MNESELRAKLYEDCEPTSWKQLLAEEMQRRGEGWTDLEYSYPSADLLELNEFCADFGFVDGEPFAAWTRQRAYFPVEYDGAEYVASVPRHPTDVATPHIGGHPPGRE